MIFELKTKIISLFLVDICTDYKFVSIFADVNKQNNRTMKTYEQLIQENAELLRALKLIIETESKYSLELPLLLHEPFMKAEIAINKSDKNWKKPKQ